MSLFVVLDEEFGLLEDVSAFDESLLSLVSAFFSLPAPDDPAELPSDDDFFA